MALTQDLFEWEVIPPDPARPSTYSRFIVVERDEFSLSCWLDAYLHVAGVTWPPGSVEPDVIAAVEAKAVADLCPALRLTGSRTPWSDEIRARRRRCLCLAREWATWRGLAPGSSPWSEPPGP